MSEPITREETYLAAIAGDDVNLPNPITREEMYLAAAAGMAVELPNPITRKEQFLQRVVESGGTGGGGVTIRNQNKTITQNGQYKADSGYTGLGTVTVNVPQEDPVLQDKTATQNGKYTADSGFDGLGTVTVAVPDPVLQDKTVTENGTVTADSGYDGLGTVTVNVESSGGGGDVARAIIGRTITEYIDSEITTVGDYAFYNCKYLRNVELPNVKTLAKSEFNGCTSLESVRMDELTEIGKNYASIFANCTSLKNVYFPKATRVGDQVFAYCTSLENADFPALTYIQGKAFQKCGKLTALVIRSQTVCTLAATNALDNTPFASDGTGGTVYVPSALISAYQTATNWATLYAAGTCNFVAIEGSEYE